MCVVRCERLIWFDDWLLRDDLIVWKHQREFVVLILEMIYSVHSSCFALRQQALSFYHTSGLESCTVYV